MRKKIILLLIVVIALPANIVAQVKTAQVGSVVENVEIRDSNNKPLMLPYFAEKHILIFYPDPDSYKENKHFTDYLEKNQIYSDNIYSFGLINLKDAPLFPNNIIRSVTRSKEKKTGAKIYTDPNYLLRDAWGLGDCNNHFVIVFVSKEGVIEFLKIGVMGEDDIEEFFKVIDQHK